MSYYICQVTADDLIADLGFGPWLWGSLPVQWLETEEGCPRQPWVTRGLYHWRSRAEGLCRWCREWCCTVSEGSEVTWHPRKGDKHEAIISEIRTVTLKHHISWKHPWNSPWMFVDITFLRFICFQILLNYWKWEVRCWDEDMRTGLSEATARLKLKVRTHLSHLPD